MWGKATEYAAEQKCEEQRTSQMEKKVQKIWQKQKRQAKSWRWLYVEKKKKRKCVAKFDLSSTSNGFLQCVEVDFDSVVTFGFDFLFKLIVRKLQI